MAPRPWICLALPPLFLHLTNSSPVQTSDRLKGTQRFENGKGRGNIDWKDDIARLHRFKSAERGTTVLLHLLNFPVQSRFSFAPSALCFAFLLFRTSPPVFLAQHRRQYPLALSHATYHLPFRIPSTSRSLRGILLSARRSLGVCSLMVVFRLVSEREADLSQIIYDRICPTYLLFRLISPALIRRLT